MRHEEELRRVNEDRNMQHEIKRNEGLLDWSRLASEQSIKTRY